MIRVMMIIRNPDEMFRSPGVLSNNKLAAMEMTTTPASTRLLRAGKNNNGLCYLPNGRTYYEYLVRSETGSPRSIAELQNLANTQILSDLTVMQRVLTGDSSSASSSITSDIFSPQGTLLTESNPEKILSTLSGKITKDFPPYPQIHTQIKYVQKSMEDYLSPAFYMIPAIDNTSENVIYINNGHLTDNLSLFTTLAHHFTKNKQINKKPDHQL